MVSQGKEAFLWLIRHGADNYHYFPPGREQIHLDYHGPTNDAIEDEWAALRRYFRDVADAERDYHEAIKRAGHRYLLKVKPLPRKESKDEPPQTSPELYGVEDIFG